MKLTNIFVLALGLGVSSSALAAEPACEHKIAGIQEQLSQAVKADNERRARGLERALAAVQENCTDALLIREKEEDIADQQEDIAEIREEIREKESEGKLDKVKKLERKLTHEEEELAVLQEELAEIKRLSAAGAK